MAQRWRIMRSTFERTYDKGQLVRIERVWVPEPGFPDFDTPEAARRTYLEALDPAFKGNSDERLAEHWKRWQRNVNTVKLVRAKGLS